MVDNHLHIHTDNFFLYDSQLTTSKFWHKSCVNIGNKTVLKPLRVFMCMLFLLPSNLNFEIRLGRISYLQSDRSQVSRVMGISLSEKIGGEWG